MMAACLLPDKGSLNVIRRSLMPFCILYSTPAVPTSLISLTSAKCVSLTVAISIPYLPSSLPTTAVLGCRLSDPALSISVCTFHVPIFKGITCVFFRRGIPVDRGQPARGLKKAIVYSNETFSSPSPCYGGEQCGPKKVSSVTQSPAKFSSRKSSPHRSAAQ